MITIFKVLALFFPMPSTKPIGEFSSTSRVGEREKRLFCVCGRRNNFIFMRLLSINRVERKQNNQPDKVTRLIGINLEISL